jgi:hypothetical protein
VTVPHELACTAAGTAETEAVTNVVKAGLEQLNKDVAGDATTALRLGKITAKLLLHDTILKAKLLLFPESDSIVAFLAAGTARTVLSRGIRATLKRLGGTEKRHTEAAADSICRTCVSGHVSVRGKSK